VFVAVVAGLSRNAQAAGGTAASTRRSAQECDFKSDQNGAYQAETDCLIAIRKFKYTSNTRSQVRATLDARCANNTLMCKTNETCVEGVCQELRVEEPTAPEPIPVFVLDAGDAGGPIVTSDANFVPDATFGTDSSVPVDGWYAVCNPGPDLQQLPMRPQTMKPPECPQGAASAGVPEVSAQRNAAGTFDVCNGPPDPARYGVCCGYSYDPNDRCCFVAGTNGKQIPIRISPGQSLPKGIINCWMGPFDHNGGELCFTSDQNCGGTQCSPFMVGSTPLGYGTCL
jgi:hypothetical protein